MKGQFVFLIISILIGFVDGIYSQPNNLTGNSVLNTSIQNKDGYLKVIDLIRPQKFHLNSISKSFMGGKNEVSLLIELPEKTKEWYYYVCASKENSSSFIELSLQMTILMSKPNAQVSQIKVNEGNSYCHVYLITDEEQKMLFDKGKPFKSNALNTRENLTSGIIQGPLVSTKNWLVIKNPRKAHAVDVVIEVVALVDTNNSN